MNMFCKIPSRVAQPRPIRIAVLAVLAAISISALGEVSTAAVASFDRYAANVESRLNQQHQSISGFLVRTGPAAQEDARLRRGELIIEHLDSGQAPSRALIHHWRGTAFVEGAKAADFERLMKNLNAYPQIFSPQILLASILSPHSGPTPDQFAASMRVRQQHVITVVMDTTYDVRYGRLDPSHGYSTSRSTKVSEIRAPGTPSERALSDSDAHGFLWRMNTYWSYEERDGGLYMQIESISLTRSVPTGLGWAIGPYVESVPRDSLAFTLRSTSNALKKR
jgi:hypothetical protein